MQKQLQKLIEFNTKFEVEFKTAPSDKIDAITVLLRKRLIDEETKEWAHDAMTNAPISHRAKELADLLYVVFGTILSEGLQDVIEKVFDAVHESNMSKLGEDGKVIRRPDGKVLKGPNYKEADLSFLNAISSTTKQAK